MVMFGDESIDALPSKQQGQGQTPTVFPNKDFSTGWNFDKTSSRFISQAVLGRPELKMLSALLTGCIVYRLSPFSKKWYHTQFAFEITTAKGIGLPFARISDKVIRLEDVRFSQSLMGLNTAD
jgi:hypothetical protein